MPDPPPRLYARHLLQFGCGYPLWTPELGTQYARYRRDGLRIGDVGVIVPENGSFDVFFNICLPREHPFHRVNGVPDNFVPIDLDELDVAIYPHAENDGSVISTSSVTTLRTIEPPDGASRQRALTYEFSLSSSEGALLILPEGAESYALLKRKLFKDVATRHGADWYKFAEQQLGRIITHDSLYLITGCYKSHSWSVAAFHETLSHAGNSEFPAQFKPGQTRPGGISAAYTWETTRALHWRVGPLGEWTAIPNQAVFISGFKIAIRDNILGRKKVAVEIDTVPARLAPQKFSGGSTGHSTASRLWGSLTSKGGGDKEAGDQAEAESVNEPGATPLLDETDDDEHVTVIHVPEAPQNVHPSDIINRYLLRKEPSADVAVTHDSQWSILINKGILNPEDLTHEDNLESIISENYLSFSQDGVACLRSVNDSSIRLADVEDAVREAWNNKLEDAEEVLSKQIIHRTSSDHTLFAHRALVRARLQHWDAALRDAETSIDIQPSVSAHVARGFALFGQQKYALASHAFNVAVRECDVRDGVLVSLIKYIVLFEVGYHAESMAGISDLIEHCSAQIKSACSAAQTETHLRLATIATKDENYERALQLLTRAESFGPFHAIQELEVISFICGWRFDNLQFSTHRQKCEVLYAAGRLVEAAESLQAMTRDLGEDVRMQEDNAKWINTFTQQSLKSLESLGDNSLNNSEAVTQNSETLSTPVGPATRDSILVKRSNAYAAIDAWEDALSDTSERPAEMRSLIRYDEAIHTSNITSVLEQCSGPQTEPISERYHMTSRGGVGYLQSPSASDPLAEEDTAVPHPEPLSIISQSGQESTDVSAESRSTDLQRSSRTLSGTLRPIKIIVVSDYVSVFCYICSKNLQDAIVACRDLPLQFDVEFRPFTLISPTALLSDQTVWQKPYLTQRFGKEYAEATLKKMYAWSQKTGLKFADDSIVAETTQAHRLAIKAYRKGGQDSQNKLNTYIFEACHTEKLDIDDEAVLVDAAVTTGLMSEQEAITFLRSTECLDDVEKMDKAARVSGIDDVPFVIIDGKWAINGLQSVGCFTQIFRKLAHLPPEKVPTAHAEVKAGRDTGIAACN